MKFWPWIFLLFFLSSVIYGETLEGPFSAEEGLKKFQEVTGRPVYHLGKDNPYEVKGLKGECTWFVYAVRKDELPTPGKGNAFKWFKICQEAGYEVGSEPKVGSIAVWNENVAGGYGHVAFVIQVNPDGSFEVWDSNWSPNLDHKIRHRKITDRKNLTGFIYWLPLKIIKTYPHDGAKNVSPKIEPWIEFSQAVDPKTLDGISLKSSLVGEEIIVPEYIQKKPKLVLVEPNRIKLTDFYFYPATFTITIKDVKSQSGARLSEAFQFSFETDDRLLIAMEKEGNFGYWLLNKNGSGLEKYLDGKEYGLTLCNDISFSPDRKEAICSMSDKEGFVNYIHLSSINLETRKIKRLFPKKVEGKIVKEDEKEVIWHGYSYYYPSISPDGCWIVCEGRIEEYRIKKGEKAWAMSAFPSEIWLIDKDGQGRKLFKGQSPQWLSDGKIFFLEDSPKIFDLKKEILKELPFSLRKEFYNPEYSPSGDYFLASSSERARKQNVRPEEQWSDLYLIQKEGEKIVVKDQKYMRDFDCSPTGEEIALVIWSYSPIVLGTWPLEDKYLRMLKEAEYKIVIVNLKEPSRRTIFSTKNIIQRIFWVSF